jgi:hypothetical protein
MTVEILEERRAVAEVERRDSGPLRHPMFAPGRHSRRRGLIEAIRRGHGAAAR